MFICFKVFNDSALWISSVKWIKEKNNVQLFAAKEMLLCGIIDKNMDILKELFLL